jgi:phage protein D
MTEELLVSSSPVFEVDGEVHGELARDLARLEIEENTDGLKTLCVRLLAFGPGRGKEEDILYLDGGILDFGKRFDVSIGPPQNARVVFSGFISAIEACFEEAQEPEVVIFAEDRLMNMRMTRRMRSYEEMSDADIAAAIAAEHGLSAQVDLDGPTYDVVQQWNMSDLAFLRERAGLLQAEIWLEDDTLHFKSREKRHATDLTLVQGNHIISLQVRADLAHQRTKVRVSGYDAQTREVVEEEAGVDVVQAEVAGGLTGPGILKRAFGERVSYRVKEVPLKDGEAADWARAEMLRRGRAFVEVSGVTRGTPDLIVGSRLTLENVGEPFNGPGYYTTSVRHTYDLVSGHRTHFKAERATIEEGL